MWIRQTRGKTTKQKDGKKRHPFCGWARGGNANQANKNTFFEKTGARSHKGSAKNTKKRSVKRTYARRKKVLMEKLDETKSRKNRRYSRWGGRKQEEKIFLHYESGKGQKKKERTKRNRLIAIKITDTSKPKAFWVSRERVPHRD